MRPTWAGERERDCERFALRFSLPPPCPSAPAPKEPGRGQKRKLAKRLKRKILHSRNFESHADYGTVNRADCVGHFGAKAPRGPFWGNFRRRSRSNGVWTQSTI